MENQRYLYAMMAQTDTGIGVIIRSITRFPYNHAALTLDPSFRSWVAFGRFIRNNPIYCGFIREPVERYLAKGWTIPVRIYRIPVSERKYRQLEQLFSRAGDPDSGLLYNYLTLITSAIHKNVPVPGAYTCLSFAGAVMDREYTSFEAMHEDLQQHLFYEGHLGDLAPDNGSREDRFFDTSGQFQACWTGLKQIGALSARFFGFDRTDLVIQKLH